MEKAERYNEGKLQWSLVDFESLEPLVEVLMYGAHKYSTYMDNEGKLISGKDIPLEEVKKNNYQVVKSGKNNWRLGLPINEVCESALRHLFAILRGELIDPESGKPHVGHFLANAMFLSYNLKKLEEENKVDLEQELIKYFSTIDVPFEIIRFNVRTS